MSHRWRSPEEVLKLDRRPLSSPKTVGVVDTVVFNEMKSAYDKVLSENVELRALVEVLEARSMKREYAKRSATSAEEELKLTIEDNRRLISRLQNELRDSQHDISLLTSKLDHKRKLFLSLQESLQASADECLELRRNLEKEHLEGVKYKEQTEEEMLSLRERLRAATNRGDVAESKCTNLMVDLREARSTFDMRMQRGAANQMYMACTAVYKRTMHRAVRQWRACTAASVAHEAHAQREARVRDRLRAEHEEHIETIQSNTKTAIREIEVKLQKSEYMRENLALYAFKSSWRVKNRAMGHWKAMFLKHILKDREGARSALLAERNVSKSVRTEVSELSRKCTWENRLKNVAVGSGLMVKAIAHHIRSRSTLRYAFNHWTSMLMLPARMLDDAKAEWESSGAMVQMEHDRASWAEAERKKSEQRLEVYRDIAGSMASVIRYQATIFRCFSSWKHYNHRQKLRRLGKWPELWRLSKLCPDESKRDSYTTSRVMHASQEAYVSPGRSTSSHTSSRPERDWLNAKTERDREYDDEDLVEPRAHGPPPPQLHDSTPNKMKPHLHQFEEDENLTEDEYPRAALDAGSTLTSTYSAGSLLFTNTLGSLRSGVLSSTGDFTTANRLFQRNDVDGRNQRRHNGEELVIVSGSSEGDSSMVQTYSRQRRHERGSFSPEPSHGGTGEYSSAASLFSSRTVESGSPKLSKGNNTQRK